jgi:hypothetical protein
MAATAPRARSSIASEPALLEGARMGKYKCILGWGVDRLSQTSFSSLRTWAASS